MTFPDLPIDEPERIVGFHVEDVTIDLDRADVWTEWLLSVADREQRPLHEVNYILCSDEYLRRINVEYLQHDYYTDVITFPYAQETLYGDVFISTDRVADNARTNGVDFQHELRRVMVHGLLHLAGYTDETPDAKAQMRVKEDAHLKVYEGL
jgi:probable rRNA maturation factor